VLTYQLAGPSIRSAAYLIDLLIRVAAFSVLSTILTCAGLALPGLSMGLFLLVLFLMEWGYFVVCEGFFRGKTIGKHIFGLRVIQERGYPLSFWSALLRNLVRAADAVPFYGPAFISMLCSGSFQRLGDRVAGTVVVAERRVVLPREPIILERIQPLEREELGSYIPSERTLSVIEEFLGRRYVLTHSRGHALAWVLATGLSRRLNYLGDSKLVDRFPMAFLARVYVTFLKAKDEPDRQQTPQTASIGMPL